MEGIGRVTREWCEEDQEKAKLRSPPRRTVPEERLSEIAMFVHEGYVTQFHQPGKRQGTEDVPATCKDTAIASEMCLCFCHDKVK